MREHGRQLPIATGHPDLSVTETDIRRYSAAVLLEDVAKHPRGYGRLDVAVLVNQLFHDWLIWLLEIARVKPENYLDEEEVARFKIVEYRFVLALNGFRVNSRIPLHHSAQAQLIELRSVVGQVIKENMPCPR